MYSHVINKNFHLIARGVLQRERREQPATLFFKGRLVPPLFFTIFVII